MVWEVVVRGTGSAEGAGGEGWVGSDAGWLAGGASCPLGMPAACGRMPSACRAWLLSYGAGLCALALDAGLSASVLSDSIEYSVAAAGAGSFVGPSASCETGPGSNCPVPCSTSRSVAGPGGTPASCVSLMVVRRQYHIEGEFGPHTSFLLASTTWSGCVVSGDDSVSLLVPVAAAAKAVS